MLHIKIFLSFYWFFVMVRNIFDISGDFYFSIDITILPTAYMVVLGTYTHHIVLDSASNHIL